MIHNMIPPATLLIAALCAASAVGQQPTPKEAAPSIKLAHPAAKYFYIDLEYIMGLTTKQEQEQLPQLKKLLFDPFMVGVDRERPVAMEVLTDAKTMRYLTFIPVSDLKEFRSDNLDAAGIDSKKLGKTLYRLEDSFGVLGFMQYQNEYAAISGKRGDVPSSIHDPKPGVKDLVTKYDLALDIQNSNVDPAAIKVRQTQFDTNVRTELLGMVKQTKLETDDQFAFRKLLTETQLDELGRLYAGARQARLGVIIDEKKKNVATMDLVVDPLPETDLAASFALLGKKPSEFANIARTENAILTARINHPLDEMRQKNFVKLSQFLRDETKQEYGKEANATDEEKANRQQAADLFFDMVDAGLKSGVFDAFAEAHPNESGKHTIVGGILAVDGTALIEALKLFPKASVGQKVELEVDAAGGVKIHKFTAATKKHALFNGFLGSDAVYIGTTKKAVWYAAGENALDELKAAILKAGEENSGKADDPLADIRIKVGPWMKLRQALTAGNTEEDKEILKLRQFAVDAFGIGDDSLTLNLKRVEDRVEGLLVGQPALLRFAGKLLADFSKETLED